MPIPNPAARTALDNSAQELAHVGGGLTLDDFRPEQIAAAERTSLRVKWYISISAVAFLLLFLVTFLGIGKFAWLCACTDGDRTDARQFDAFLVGWAFALGGLGATASVFIHVLKLTPQQTLRSSDEFEVFGRIILGCLFSTIFGLTFAAAEIKQLFDFINGAAPALTASQKSGSTSAAFAGSTLMVLLPFFAGYSIQLVLKILEKLIRAVELTIGVDDPRDPTMRKSTRRGMRSP